MVQTITDMERRRNPSQTLGAGTFPQVPPSIRNIAHWEENCRKIHARAQDLIDGKIGVIEAAQRLCVLSTWIHARKDKDFSVFLKIGFEIIALPVGTERQYWAKQALEREDAKIQILEEYWRPAALAAAHRLVKKYRWALAARQRRRMQGRARNLIKST